MHGAHTTRPVVTTGANGRGVQAPRRGRRRAGWRRERGRCPPHRPARPPPPRTAPPRPAARQRPCPRHCGRGDPCRSRHARRGSARTAASAASSAIRGSGWRRREPHQRRRRWESAPTWMTGPARAAPMAVLWPRQAVTAKGCGGGSSRLQGRPQAPPVQRRVAASGPHQAGRLPRRIFFTLAAPAAVSRRGAAVARRTATLAHRVAASRVDAAARRWRRWQPLPLSQCRCCRLAGRRSRCCGCRGAGEGGSLTRPVEGR